MYSYDQLINIIDKECSKVAAHEEPRNLYQPICYIMENGGKRMRPMLTLLVANIFSDDITKAINCAIAIEVFHNFTLVHDDIMDNAPIRRGRATVHTRWNENTAILSGDAMFPMAYSILCRDADANRLPLIMCEFNKVTLEVFKGQQFDMDFQSKTNVTMKDYLEMIRHKTAVLLASGMKLGAISAGASEDNQQLIYDFGINIGMAFQIQDDLLDTYGDAINFGKTIGGDIAQGKQTYLMIAAKEQAFGDQKKILNASTNFKEIKSIYDELGVHHAAKTAIEKYFKLAIESLNLIQDHKERLQPTIEYAMNLLGRDK